MEIRKGTRATQETIRALLISATHRTRGLLTSCPLMKLAKFRWRCFRQNEVREWACMQLHWYSTIIQPPFPFSFLNKFMTGRRMQTHIRVEMEPVPNIKRRRNSQRVTRSEIDNCHMLAPIPSTVPDANAAHVVHLFNIFDEMFSALDSFGFSAGCKTSVRLMPRLCWMQTANWVCKHLCSN